MKKILSIVLTLAMMLTMVSILPVQAEEATDVATYPYINYSFDTDKTGIARDGGNYKSEWSSEEGVAGVPGSVLLTMSGSETGYPGDIHLSVPDLSLLIGKKMKISCWAKIDTTKTKVKANSLTFLVFGKTATTSGDSSAHKYLSAAKMSGDLNSGNWVYTETILDNWNGTMSDNDILLREVSIAPRIGGSAGGGTMKEGLADDSPTRSIVWYLDEVRVEPVVETNEEVVVDENVLFYDGCSGNKKVNGGTYNSGIGHDGKAGYASYEVTAAKPGYADFTSPNVNVKANTWYKISLWGKADDAATVGDFVQINLMRQSRLDKTVDSSDAADHPAPYAGNAYQMIRLTEKRLTNDWQYYEVYFKRNVKTFDNKTMSIWFRCGDDTKARKFSYDDFKIEEVGGAVTNGDFELKKTDIPSTPHSGSNETAKDDYNRYGTFYGWHEVGATASVSTDVRPDSEGTQSAKIVTTAAGAELHQGLFVQNNTDMEFKFWAKGEGESVGKPIQVKLDRKVSKKDALDVYNVPDTELLGEDMVLTDEWQEYTVRYTPSFTASGTASAGVIPRLPFMSIVVDGGASGLTYYLDDITFEKYEEQVTEVVPPKAANVSVDGVAVTGSTVYPYWDLDSVNGGLDNTFVRVAMVQDNGEEATLAIEPLMYAYTIPEHVLGASLRFDILPGEQVGDEFLYGSFTSVKLGKVKPAMVITPTLGEFDAVNGSVTGKLYVENNTQDTLELFMVLALYDANDCAIRYEAEPISVAGGLDDDITVSVSTAAVEGFADVAKVKAFVWGGTGVFDTDMTPYADVLVVEK